MQYLLDVLPGKLYRFEGIQANSLKKIETKALKSLLKD